MSDSFLQGKPLHEFLGITPEKLELERKEAKHGPCLFCGATPCKDVYLMVPPNERYGFPWQHKFSGVCRLCADDVAQERVFKAVAKILIKKYGTKES